MILPMLLAYAVGSIPVGYLVPKLASGIDIRRVGSGNPGFTNVYRAAGAGPGVVVLVADIGKGILAVLLARSFGAGETGSVLAGLAAIAGHVTTPFLGFRGGKGVATTVGVFFTLLPLETVICLLLFGAVVAATRYVSLGSVVMAIALPLLTGLVPALRGRPFRTAHFVMAAAVAVMIVVRHRANLGRLRAGKENRFSFRRRKET
ncbi:MAG: glycerol-3-phosphate 1-O-acyltransferase PlsY [Candidatus Eisenbacteria bacterium]